ncbi:hypothetical protein [Caballeronia sp. S22]|uniref:hypothetical protein n=1 Tax=Caballeronia sp. S22 TaxID=3137182 RepID=UPI00353087FF
MRILNDDDRQTLVWLRTHVGDTRVAEAACRLIAQRETSVRTWSQPYVSAVCRYLGVWPPTSQRSLRVEGNHAVADQHLAQMRQLLAQRTMMVRKVG